MMDYLHNGLSRRITEVGFVGVNIKILKWLMPRKPVVHQKQEKKMFTVKQIINNATSLYEQKKSPLLVLVLSNGVRLCSCWY